MKSFILDNVYNDFISIQGEGKYTGRLSYFVRFFGCNLFCKWCDSAYANDIDNQEYTYNLNLYSEILKNKNIKHIVFTGGEPLLKRQELVDYTNFLINKGYYVTIETNGSIFYSDFINSKRLLFSISPKLENSLPVSGMERKIHKKIINLIPERVYGYIKRYPDNYILKFVVSTEKDMKDIKNFIREVNSYNEHYNVDNNKIYLMPLGANKNQLKKNKEFVVKQCLKNGYNYSPRLQIDIWNTRRGV